MTAPLAHTLEEYQAAYQGLLRATATERTEALRLSKVLGPYSERAWSGPQHTEYLRAKARVGALYQLAVVTLHQMKERGIEPW